MSEKPAIIETDAQAMRDPALPGGQTAVSSSSPRPVAPSAQLSVPDDGRFSTFGRVVCGLIAAVFAAGVVLTPELWSLFYVRAFFLVGVYVFGRVAIQGGWERVIRAAP